MQGSSTLAPSCARITIDFLAESAEVDIEDTVKDERQGGSVYLSLPNAEDLPNRARGLRELASAAPTFGFNPSLKPARAPWTAPGCH